ncbi:MAG: glycoside hydrolase 43 family protein [Bacteroidales bacterium]|nr:glycoside hydrolase 43 family protein [Bacteroidales bacterium]
MKKRHQLLVCSIILSLNSITAQIWVPDLGNGTYQNPVIYADYSDPDVIRVNDDFFLVASSFNCMPGIPVLHSKDLINWRIINHIYQSLPFEKYNKPVHGEGSWAPSIRFHNGLYYVFFCTPHEGLFMARTGDPSGQWELHHIVDVEMWEDPCPFWDDTPGPDGEKNAYLVRSKLCGNALYLHKMSADGTKILDNGTMIFQDISQPTIEGPKLYKRGGYYYIFAPAGGVPHGWQTVLRSKNIYGPYETRNIIHQGNTDINGPHQGALVELKSGECWFMHFQDKGLYGRIVHLQPVNWMNNWPLAGTDINNDGIGEPVARYKKPVTGKNSTVMVPQTSDEFNSDKLGLQWQWHANPKNEWYSLLINPGSLRLYTVNNPTQNGNFWFVPNLLLQKFPSPAFTVTTRIDFKGDMENDRAGLIIMGERWKYLAMVKTKTGTKLETGEGSFNQCDDMTLVVESAEINNNVCYLRVTLNPDGICQFSYSTDNQKYALTGKESKAQKGRWIGAKVGLFCISPGISKSPGYADFDWFRFE